MDMSFNGYSFSEVHDKAIFILNDYFNGFQKYLDDFNETWDSYDYIFQKYHDLSTVLLSFNSIFILSDDDYSFYSDWRDSYHRKLNSFIDIIVSKKGV